jgi:hypothetical protein
LRVLPLDVRLAVAAEHRALLGLVSVSVRSIDARARVPARSLQLIRVYVSGAKLVDTLVRTRVDRCRWTSEESKNL